jgi:hypothetical protein
MRSWTHAEEEALRYLASRLSGPELAVAFGRTHAAIKIKASKLGIRIGANEDTHRIPPTSPAVLKRVVEIIHAELCPACGKRAIGVKSTGLCGPCHYEKLREVHEEEIARVEAQRDLWAARSKLRRRREAAATAGEAPA